MQVINDYINWNIVDIYMILLDEPIYWMSWVYLLIFYFEHICLFRPKMFLYNLRNCEEKRETAKWNYREAVKCMRIEGFWEYDWDPMQLSTHIICHLDRQLWVDSCGAHLSDTKAGRSLKGTRSYNYLFWSMEERQKIIYTCIWEA
jgi:hypothetical protein